MPHKGTVAHNELLNIYITLPKANQAIIADCYLFLLCESYLYLLGLLSMSLT